VLVFIDESGDPGFNFSKGASLFFVMAMVVFESEGSAEKVARIINRMKPYPDFEFKFNKLDYAKRISLLKKLSQGNFKVTAIVYDKRNMLVRKGDKGSFHSDAIKELLISYSDKLHNARIRIDGSNESEYKNSFLYEIRRTLNTRSTLRVKDIRFEDSKLNTLMQVADIVVGSIARLYSTKTDSSDYFALIASKIEEVIEVR
jgi:hypothetical protein